MQNHPALNPDKSGKMRKRSIEEQKGKPELRGTSRPDILQVLVETLCRFHERPIAPIGDIEQMFLQLQDFEKNISSLRFLWPRRTNNPVQA